MVHSSIVEYTRRGIPHGAIPWCLSDRIMEMQVQFLLYHVDLNAWLVFNGQHDWLPPSKKEFKSPTPHQLLVECSGLITTPRTKVRHSKCKQQVWSCLHTKLNMRPQFNGRILLCQSKDTGSLPVGRSKNNAEVAQRQLQRFCKPSGNLREFESHLQHQVLCCLVVFLDSFLMLSSLSSEEQITDDGDHVGNTN